MVERRQKILFGVILACFALFAVQLVSIQVFGHTDPPTLAHRHEATPSMQRDVPKTSTAGLDVRFRNWWHRNVEAKLDSAPNKVRATARKIWKKFGAA